MFATFGGVAAADPLFFAICSSYASSLNARSVLERSSAVFYSEETLFMGSISLFYRNFSSSFSNYRKPIYISSCNGRTLRTSSGRNSVSSWEESARIFFNRNSKSRKNDQNDMKNGRGNEEHSEDSDSMVFGGEEAESVRFLEDNVDELRNKVIKNGDSNRFGGRDRSDCRQRVRGSLKDDMKERTYNRRGAYDPTVRRKNFNRRGVASYGDRDSRVSGEEIQTKVQEIEKYDSDSEGGSHKPGSSLKKFGGGIDEEDDRAPHSDKSHRSSQIFADNEDDEDVDDPRWKNIRERSRNVLEVREWGKQERWGKKVMAETTMSSTKLKMTGEGIYGISPVLAALCAKRREFYTLYTQKGMEVFGSLSIRKRKAAVRLQRILNLAGEAGVPTKEASKHDLNMAVDSRPHQGFILDASPLDAVRVHRLDPVDPTVVVDPPPVWVALDEVTDPQNLGAIIRSAFFFGAAGVVVCTKNSAPLSGVVSKASSGALEVVELTSCNNMMKFLMDSSSNGWRVLGASVSHTATPVRDVPRTAPTILVLGNEGSGLRVLVERSCSELVRITGSDPSPDHGSVASGGFPFFSVESLNVSVAAGVFLHHLVSKDQ